MIGRKDMRKETMAKRARSRVMDDKMAKKMMSPRKMMSMGKSPGPGMGADSAPMAFKKGGAVTKGSIMGTGKTKASAKSDYMKKMKAAGFADGGMVRSSDEDKTKRLSTTTGITAEQYQQAKAQNTDIGQMSPEQRAQRRATMGAQRDQARQQKMDRFKTFATNRPTAEPVRSGITNSMARKAAEASAMMKVQRDIRQAKRAGVDVQSAQSARDAQRAPGLQTQPGPGRITQPGPMLAQKTAAFKKGGMVKKGTIRKYAEGGLVASNQMTPGMMSQLQMRGGYGELPMQGGPGLQRQPGPMPMQGGPGLQRQPGPMPMQGMSAQQQKMALMKRQMDARKAAKQQSAFDASTPADRQAMMRRGMSAEQLQQSGTLTPPSLAKQLSGKSAPSSGMLPSPPNSAAMAQQALQQGKMQQAGTSGMGSQSASPAFKKGGMVKKPASKNPTPMGPKGGKAGMMLIIGFGKKGKK